jgi:hypothetical protein
MGKIYVYDTTRGAGVPGLPHEIDESEARQLGVEDILRAAIANGSYKLKTETKQPAAKREE